MFIGYQSELKAFVAETREELENLPFIELTKIEEVSFAQMFDGVIYTDTESLTKAKQDFMRDVRNYYLVEYVDGAVSNPLRWADLTAEEQQVYADYRRYLLDYTNGENWWEAKPKTLEEWRDESVID